MQAKIQKWGNSLALRIPKAFAQEIKIAENSTVELNVEDGQINIKPIIEYETPKLDDLLDEVNESNIHYEIQTGKPQGKEIW